VKQIPRAIHGFYTSYRQKQGVQFQCNLNKQHQPPQLPFPSKDLFTNIYSVHFCVKQEAWEPHGVNPPVICFQRHNTAVMSGSSMPSVICRHIQAISLCNAQYRGDEHCALSRTAVTQCDTNARHMSANMNLDILGKHGCSLRDAPSILCLRHFDSVNTQTSALN